MIPSVKKLQLYVINRDVLINKNYIEFFLKQNILEKKENVYLPYSFSLKLVLCRLAIDRFLKDIQLRIDNLYEHVDIIKKEAGEPRIIFSNYLSDQLKCCGIEKFKISFSYSKNKVSIALLPIFLNY